MTQVKFGAGISVGGGDAGEFGPVTVLSRTRATAEITIADDADLDDRSMAVRTREERVSFKDCFTVTRPPRRLTVTPDRGRQNETLTVTLVGVGTRFQEGNTEASFGEDISVGGRKAGEFGPVVISGPNRATAQIRIEGDADLEARTVKVRTRQEVVTLKDGFTVQPVPAQFTLSPVIGRQGQTLTITIQGSNTHFRQRVTEVKFGDGIAVGNGSDGAYGSVTVTSPTQLTARIKIDDDADPDFRTVRIRTDAEKLSNTDAFTVLPKAAPITVFPNTGQRGETLTVTISSPDAHFVQGDTEARFGAGIEVGGEEGFGPVTVLSRTRATAELSIRSAARLGDRHVIVRTGKERFFLRNGFEVLSAPRTLSLAPAGGQQGQRLTVQITGFNTHFAPGVTKARFGTGVIVGAGEIGDFGLVTVTSPIAATAELTIAPDALVGIRTVVVNTSGESVALVDGFAIGSSGGSGPPLITLSVSPVPNAAGWNRANVTVTFTCSSGLGIASCPAPTQVTTEGGNQVVSGTAIDNAGNTAAASVVVRLDKTAPTLAFGAASPTPNGAGWNNTNVAFGFTAADALSGVASTSVPSPLSLTIEGAAVNGAVTVTDIAGNSATVPSPSAKIDKTPPTLAFGGAGPAPNGAGWNNTNVAFSFTAADALSGVATTSVPSPLSLTAEGSSVNGVVTVTDIAGNSATVTSPSAKIDKTPPTLTFGPQSPAPNGAGWNNTNVVFVFTAADSLSGVATTSVPSPLSLSMEGAPVNGAVTVTDVAGNTATVTSPSARIDKTPPTLTFGGASPAPNGAGWNNTNVAFSFTAADALSGVAATSIPSPLSLTTEGASVNGAVTVTDVAGNSATLTSPSAKIDKTPPMLTFGAASPAPNGAGWNNTNVAFAFTTTDTLSGVVTTSAPSPLALIAEGLSVSGAVTVTDAAGNSATVNSPSANIDRTPPTLTFGPASPSPNGAGWNNTDVTFAFTAADALSRLVTTSVPSPLSLMTEGASVNGVVIATDVAGNSATFTTPSAKIDKTPPLLSFGPASPAANAAGWNNTDLALSFSASDALSGVASTSVPSPLSLTTEGASVTGVVTVTDVAGNSATVTSPSAKIDKTPPTLTFGPASPAANAAGWNNTDVAFGFTAADTLSGVAATSIPSPQSLSAEGSSVNGAVTVADVAGNSATVPSPSAKIDKTPPSVVTQLSQPANANGWHRTDVTVSFAATDSLSGVDTVSSPVTVIMEGANQAIAGTATDIAGNTASASVAINLDKTPPSMTSTAAPPANAAGWHRTDVTVTFAGTDGLSGVVTLSPPVTLANEGANQTASGSVTDKAGNTAMGSIAVSLDKTAPSLAVTSPADGATVSNASQPVQGIFTEALSGLASLACNGTPVAPLQSPFSCNVTLVEGPNAIAVTAADTAGNASASNVNVTLQSTPVLLSVTPDRGQQGQQLMVSVAGQATHFVPGSTQLDLGPGVTVGAVTVGSPTALTAQLDVSAAAAVGFRPATVTTGAEIVTLTNAFDVRPGPTIVTSVDRPPNPAGWYNADVTVTFTCNDSIVGIAACPPPVVVSAEGANQPISGTAVNNVGVSVTASIAINLDKTPPVAAFTSPADGATVFNASLTAVGTVTDALSGVASAACNGAAVTLNGGGFQCGVTVAPGANTIDASAVDIAGNTGTSMLSLTYAKVPQITLAAPANLSYLNITPTTVTGTVDDPTATITINSIGTPVLNGSFSLALPLAEGPNIITASATSGGGAAGTTSIEVTLDTTPPHVTVTSLPDRFVTTDASITVAGNVNDIVVGTVNDQQASVTVNGAAAQVSNRTFLAMDVPLTLGSNVIQVVGRDRVGNFATTQITVNRQPVTQSQIRLLSGNNQTGPINTALASPLVVALTDTAGNPVPNKTVIFKVVQNNGLVATTGLAAPTVLATTDAQGLALASWTLGMRAGAGGNAVEAYSVGFGGTAIFTATGAQGPAGKIVVDTGNDQIGAIGQPLPKPLIVVAVDDGNNRLSGIPITFSIGAGSGTLQGLGGLSAPITFTPPQTNPNAPGQTSVTVMTVSDGRAAATLTLGMQEGNANNLVSANFPSNTGFPATFTASGRFVGDPAKTIISGVVLDNSNVPIPGVTLRAVSTNALHSSAATVQSAISVQTNPQGQFSIPQAPVGFVKLIVDGSTAQLSGQFPSLEYDMVTVAGQNNTVGAPIYILPLNTANSLCVTATTGGGTLTIPEAPGFSLTFGPGQVTFPGGSKTGCVSVTTVHGDRVPMVPGFGQQPRFIVTIQPAGAVFNPPAPITLPNVDGLMPRAVTEMYSFDHDISSFVAIGTGTVSDDGQVIRSNVGVGVLKAGWHCGGDPNVTGLVQCSPPPRCTGAACLCPPTSPPAGSVTGEGFACRLARQAYCIAKFGPSCQVGCGNICDPADNTEGFGFCINLCNAAQIACLAGTSCPFSFP